MMITSIYSILHFFVDGICALAMYSFFTGGTSGYWDFLVYNFCAFALQMPLGTLLDYLNRSPANDRRQTNFACLFAGLGLILTLIGSVVHPAVLGLGNAFFHIGGGVDVIHEDYRNGWKGRALGVFVAPGALGLYVGSLLAKYVDEIWILAVLVGTGMVMIGLLLPLKTYIRKKEKRIPIVQIRKLDQSGLLLLAGCLLVVILRSYVGLAVIFQWKTTILAGVLSVLAVVFGKMAGGILSASFGMKKVILVSLILSAGAYGFSGKMIYGIVALFLFNMTMPITLYLLIERFRNLPGFCFGLLTFGLFLGYLPVYYDINSSLSGSMIGMLGSILSLIILLAVLAFNKEGQAYEQ